MKNIVTTTAIEFSLASIANKAAVARVTEKLPELTEKTRAFDRSNSQTTLNMMSLTMMNGQSPMRMLRQVLAEVEQRKMALAEAQLSHAKLLVEIDTLSDKEKTPVVEAELRLKNVSLSMLEKQGQRRIQGHCGPDRRLRQHQGQARHRRLGRNDLRGRREKAPHPARF